VGEFLASLDKIAALDVRLCLSGHGKPFVDIPGHIEANRSLVAERCNAARAALNGRPLTAVEVAPLVFGEPLSRLTAQWRLSETLCYLRHLEVVGEAARAADGEVERWALR
jgi:hypothetical protein